MDAWDAPEALREAVRRPVDFEVLPENWAAWRLFLDVQTQWRTAPMGGVIGLDYIAVDVVMRITATTDHADTFQRLQLIEAGALPEINRKRN